MFTTIRSRRGVVDGESSGMEGKGMLILMGGSLTLCESFRVSGRAGRPNGDLEAHNGMTVSPSSVVELTWPPKQGPGMSSGVPLSLGVCSIAGGVGSIQSREAAPMSRERRAMTHPILVDLVRVALL